MDKKEIERLLYLNIEIIESLEKGYIKEAYQKMITVSLEIQNFIMLLLEYQILEEEIVIALLNDMVEAMEKKDDVLMIDTLKYGINSIMQQIIMMMEEA